MKITFENYTIEPEDIRFNLYKNGKGKTKDGQEKDTSVAMGYGMTMERCIKIIAADITNDSGETITLRDYLSEFKNTVNRLEKILK